MAQLTDGQRAVVKSRFKFLQTMGGDWTYMPHDYDDSLEVWSCLYRTLEEAERAAWEELRYPAEPEQAD